MHILITGASSGIGLAIAKRFASSEISDVRISICSRNLDSIIMARSEIEKMSPDAKIFAAKCDVSQSGDVERFVEDSKSALGVVDVLVNNAGIGLFHPVLDMETSNFDQVLATNLRGAFIVTKAILPQMKEQKRGTIVSISSVSGKIAFTGGASYCASKFGLRGLMQSLFLDVRGENIRVVTIFPGNAATNFFRAAGVAPSVSENILTADDIAETVYASVMLPDRATVSELDLRPTNPKK